MSRPDFIFSKISLFKRTNNILLCIQKCLRSKIFLSYVNIVFFCNPKIEKVFVCHATVKKTKS